MDLPKVSIVIPSYKHEQFITETLESVVKQTYQNFEMLIVDDASPDHSVDVIQSFIQDHPENSIKFVCHEENQGGVRTLNHLVSMASGEYIALINSDDVWMPDKLEQQVKYLDEHPELSAVFTQAVIVDENKRELTKQEMPVCDVFLQQNRSRGLWLRRFFYEQNCLCHPSILIRRSVYDQMGLYDARFRQIPDFQMWVRFVKAFEFHLIEQPMVLLRWHATNTSVINVSNSTRGLNELFYLYREFFNNIPDQVFIDGFQDLFRNKDASTPEELACEKAFLYFTPTTYIKSIYNNIGLDRLFTLLGNPETRKVLEEKYQFSYDDFFVYGGTNIFDGSLFQSLVPNAAPAAVPTAQSAQSLTGIPTFMTDRPSMPQRIYRKLKMTTAGILIKYPPLYNAAHGAFDWLRRGILRLMHH